MANNAQHCWHLLGSMLASFGQGFRRVDAKNHALGDYSYCLAAFLKLWGAPKGSRMAPGITLQKIFENTGLGSNSSSLNAYALGLYLNNDISIFYIIGIF